MLGNFRLRWLLMKVKFKTQNTIIFFSLFESKRFWWIDAKMIEIGWKVSKTKPLKLISIPHDQTTWIAFYLQTYTNCAVWITKKMTINSFKKDLSDVFMINASMQ